MNAVLQCILRSRLFRRLLEIICNAARPDNMEKELSQQLLSNQAKDQLTEPLAHYEQLKTFKWYSDSPTSHTLLKHSRVPC